MNEQQLSFWIELARYTTWLSQANLKATTKRAYNFHLEQFALYLKASDRTAELLSPQGARDAVVAEYLDRCEERAGIASRNAALTALRSLFFFMGQAPLVAEHRPTVARRAPALTPEEIGVLLHHVDKMRSVRDRAILLLLLNTGIRISECALLDMEDVQCTARYGKIIIGNDRSYRQVPLNDSCRKRILDWLLVRSRYVRTDRDTAVFITLSGSRMSVSAIDSIIRRRGSQAGLVLCAGTLRNTFFASLVADGHSLEHVAQIGGYRKIDTMRRFTTPWHLDVELEDMQKMVHSVGLVESQTPTT